MERRFKKKLAAYYEAPRPKKKQAFLRQLGVQKIDVFHLAVMQMRYISKWVWMVSVLFCGLAYGITYMMEEKYVSMVLAFVPFLVMLSVTETMRSYRYGMEELELSARFSLKSIVMARMLMLGLGNFAVLVVVMILLGKEYDFHMLYVLTPYFLTAGGGLCIVRNVRGNENTFLCFALAGVVSALQILLPWQFDGLYLPDYTPLWAVVCAMGIGVTMRESYRAVRMTEDLAWN